MEAVPLPRPPLMSREIAAAAVAEAVAAEGAVLAAYLFGSLVRGTPGPLSDLDVGVILSEEADVDEVSGRLRDAVCRRLRTERIDVVSLTASPVPLRYRVVRDGILVMCRGAAARERFTCETVLQYLDFKPLPDSAFGRVGDAILRPSTRDARSGQGGMMVADTEIVRDRESRIRGYVKDLRDLGRISEQAFLDNRERQDAVLHALQLAIEAAVDIATHICAADDLGIPASYAEAFDLLEKGAVVDPPLGEDLRRMARFRNRIVHFDDCIHVVARRA